MKFSLITIAFLTASVSHAQETDTAYWEEVDSLMYETWSQPYFINPTFRSNLNYESDSIHETWDVYDRKDGILTIKISYWKNLEYYEEEYYLYKGELVRASEKEHWYYDYGSNDHSIWSGEYQFEHGTLVNYSTNGHGRSETDEWDPETWVLDRFKIRMEELKLLRQ